MTETAAAGVKPGEDGRWQRVAAHLHLDQGHLSLGMSRIADIVDDLVVVASAAGRGSLEGAGR
jgi:hypothetical protein